MYPRNMAAFIVVELTMHRISIFGVPKRVVGFLSYEKCIDLKPLQFYKEHCVLVEK
jgi:hypothetical protein